MSFTLKNKLADCLGERQIRQSQLARRLDMSPAYVSRLLNGHIAPSIEMALRIARYFDKPLESIFQLEPSDENLAKNFPPRSATDGTQTTRREQTKQK
jgi:putative transcriptional regulator